MFIALVLLLRLPLQFTSTIITTTTSITIVTPTSTITIAYATSGINLRHRNLAPFQESLGGPGLQDHFRNSWWRIHKVGKRHPISGMPPGAACYSRGGCQFRNSLRRLLLLRQPPRLQATTTTSTTYDYLIQPISIPQRSLMKDSPRPRVPSQSGMFLVVSPEVSQERSQFFRKAPPASQEF